MSDKPKEPTLDELLDQAREILKDPEHISFGQGGPALILRLAVRIADRLAERDELLKRLIEHQHQTIEPVLGGTPHVTMTTRPVGFGSTRL